jgi:hypothetical protein
VEVSGAQHPLASAAYDWGEYADKTSDGEIEDPVRNLLIPTSIPRD